MYETPRPEAGAFLRNGLNGWQRSTHDAAKGITSGDASKGLTRALSASNRKLRGKSRANPQRVLTSFKPSAILVLHDDMEGNP